MVHCTDISYLNQILNKAASAIQMIKMEVCLGILINLQKVLLHNSKARWRHIHIDRHLQNDLTVILNLKIIFENLRPLFLKYLHWQKLNQAEDEFPFQLIAGQKIYLKVKWLLFRLSVN